MSKWDNEMKIKTGCKKAWQHMLDIKSRKHFGSFIYKQI